MAVGETCSHFSGRGNGYRFLREGYRGSASCRIRQSRIRLHSLGSAPIAGQVTRDKKAATANATTSSNAERVRRKTLLTKERHTSGSGSRLELHW